MSFSKTLLLAGLVFVPAVTGILNNAHAETLSIPLDKEMVQRRGNLGYTDEEIQTYFSAPLLLEIDRTGLNREMLKPPPPNGVHPRVLFNPEDLPAIRNRLERTASGRLVLSNIRKHVEKELRSPGGSVHDIYNQLVAGENLESLDSKQVTSAAFITLYEAFLCLLDNDEANGCRAAAAITSLARITDREVLANRAIEASKENPWMNFQGIAKGPSYQGTLGLMYDFVHGWMTEDQRAITRTAIANASAGLTYIGAETLRTLHSNTSNWIPWTSRMIFLVASIEGEPGYDPKSWDRCVEAMTAFIAAFFDTGEAYEGWGKNYVFYEHLAVIGKRGRDVVAATKLRNVFRQYFVHALLPWGNGFTFYDSQGGTGSGIARNADVVMYRHFFPDDPAGEYIFRNQIRGDYGRLTEPNRINTRHPFSVTDALCVALYATDFDSDLPDPDARARVTRDRPLSLYTEDTGNLITRTDWSPDSLYLYYLNRGVIGGHRYSDRSHFSLYSHGRPWGIYRSMRQIDSHRRPHNRSVVTTAEDGPSYSPARCVAFADTPDATLVASDLSIPWDFGGLVPYSFNHYRINRDSRPWMDFPVADLPDWMTSLRPVPKPGKEKVAPSRTPGVRYAYRSALLVRGKHPYVLVVDDVQIDDQPHDYLWNMTVADDVVVRGSSRSGEGAMNDLLLGEKETVEGKPERRLLVRQLDESAQATTPESGPRLENLVLPNPPQPDINLPKIVLPDNSVVPGYRVLLFPHVEGAPLPTTRWNTDRTRLRIDWPDQSDEIVFSSNEDHRTRLDVLRTGKSLLSR